MRARQRLDQCGFPMIDMTGGPDDDALGGITHECKGRRC